MRRLNAVCGAGLLCLAALLLSAGAAGAQTKVALVVGNGAYRGVSPLTNPTNDARDVGASFERLGFEVRRVVDGSFDDMRRALLEFNRKARSAEVAIVYFAGHGIEVGGENYLIPIDAELKTDIDVDHEAIGLRSVMPSVESASKLGLVILDACRNNPFSTKMQRTVRTRSVSRGLAGVEPSGNVLVAYAAKDGTTAADGTGRNSPFTTSLLKHIETPGLEINFLFRNVRDDVIKATRREQQPFVYGSLSSDTIYLKPAPVAPPPPAAPTADELTWAFLKDTEDQGAIKRFIEQFPKSGLRKDAEKRLAALVAADAKNKAAPPPPPTGPSAEDVSWALIKDSKDPDQFRLFLVQFPQSGRRPEAEARVAALATAQEKAPPPLPTGPSAEDIAWTLVSESKDPDQFRRFLEQFPNSPRQRDAANRINLLTVALAQEKARFEAERARFETERDKGNAPPPLDPKEVARYLQFELKRVGCFGGAVDGQFTDPTKAALRNFAKLASLNLSDKEPTLDALKAVRGMDKRICPLVCKSGERADGERCVRITCNSDQVLRNGACVDKPEPRRVSASPPPRPRPQPREAAPAPSRGGGGKCFAFNGRQFCE
jgi:hypothetical protein